MLAIARIATLDVLTYCTVVFSAIFPSLMGLCSDA
jgi:hypothetical protein